jgi:hypothetical protein
MTKVDHHLFMNRKGLDSSEADSLLQLLKSIQVAWASNQSHVGCLQTSKHTKWHSQEQLLIASQYYMICHGQSKAWDSLAQHLSARVHTEKLILPLDRACNRFILKRTTAVIPSR